MSKASKPEVVRAKRMGFYKGNRVKPGVTFSLLRPEDFTESWMERCADGTADQLQAITGDARPHVVAPPKMHEPIAAGAKGNARDVI